MAINDFWKPMDTRSRDEEEAYELLEPFVYRKGEFPSWEILKVVNDKTIRIWRELKGHHDLLDQYGGLV
jgi:hypothetical protein